MKSPVKLCLCAMLMCCCAMPGISISAQNPFEEAILNQYEGVFASEDMLLILENHQLAYVGLITLKEKTYAVQAEIIEGILKGQFIAEDQTFQFSLTKQDGKMIYSASPQHQVELIKQLPFQVTETWKASEDDLSIEFKDKKTGLIHFQGNSFEFKLTQSRVIMKGTFKVGENESYHFQILPSRSGTAWFSSSVYKMKIESGAMPKHRQASKSKINARGYDGVPTAGATR